MRFLSGSLVDVSYIHVAHISKISEGPLNAFICATRKKLGKFSMVAVISA